MRAEWLARYASGYHRWRTAQENDGRTVFYRPLGVVETSFDADGLYHEGRADLNLAIHFDMKTTLSLPALKKHINTAWTCLRLRHALLCATATSVQDFMDDDDAREKAHRFFVVRQPRDAAEAWRSSAQLVTFMDEICSSVDADEFYAHAQNTARTFDPSETLARLFVLPVTKNGNTGTFSLRFLLTIAHQISDGLTNNAWAEDLVTLLNTTPSVLESSLPALLPTIQSRLPVPQEDLYQPICPGSRARQRWFWAITVVLRHVQKPMPPAFLNPLRYNHPPIPPSVIEPSIFAPALDYSRAPTLNAGTILAQVDRIGTRRLHQLCRQAGCSLGAGSFVLVAIAMMEIHEQRFLLSAPDDAPFLAPFIGSFPINPRPFFNHTATPDGAMLAFSDGVVLPFLPSHLELDGRIKLLVRSAQRQLSRYQKKRRREEEQASRSQMLQYMGARGAGRLVPIVYLDVLERMNSKLPPDDQLRMALPYAKHFPKQANPTMATCGVSSVGRANPALEPGRYDLGKKPMMDGEGEEQFVVDVQSTRQNVRPRNGEFLAGVWGNDESIWVTVSYDACAIDPKWARVFEVKIETLLGTSKATLKL